MYTITQQKGFNKYLKTGVAVFPQALTTAGSAINGTDLATVTSPDKYEAAMVNVLARVTVKAHGKTSFACKLQHGDTTTAYTDTPWADGTTVQTLTVTTTGTTATQTNVAAALALGVRIAHLKAHARVVITPTLPVSSSNVTTGATVSAGWVFGGSSGEPLA